MDDLEKIKNESSFAIAISGVVQNNNAVVIGGEGSVQVRLQGVEPDFPIARDWKINSGYFFDDEDLYLRSAVAVLGRTTAKNLFGSAENALAAQIRIGSVYFTVIGILENKGADFEGRDQDDIVIVPMSTAMTRLYNSPYINMIVIAEGA